jgi:hypothetical protein
MVIEDRSTKAFWLRKIVMIYLLVHYYPVHTPELRQISQHLAPTFERAAASGESFAVLRIDLDHFTQIDEFFARSLGEVLLCEVAKRLRIGYPLTIEHYSDVVAPPRSATRLMRHEGGASRPSSLELARGHRS